MSSESIKIIECPRDAMQSLGIIIPTESKIRYINKLLSVGFDTIDFGSFVSPKAIPQLRDTAEVLANLDLSPTKSILLAIIANLRGANDACSHPEIKYLGFPFSISETFQKKNINATIKESLGRVKDIQNINELSIKHNKKLVIYISMAFGNPYGDEWNYELVYKWVEKLTSMGIEIIALSDTIGISTPETINIIFTYLIKNYPKVEFGAHFHTTPDLWKEKVDAAYDSGCRRFDGAIKGLGGCPMSGYKLVGNMPTENLISFFNGHNIQTGITEQKFYEAALMASEIF